MLRIGRGRSPNFRPDRNLQSGSMIRSSPGIDNLDQTDFVEVRIAANQPRLSSATTGCARPNAGPSRHRSPCWLSMKITAPASRNPIETSFFVETRGGSKASLAREAARTSSRSSDMLSSSATSPSADGTRNPPDR